MSSALRTLAPLLGAGLALLATSCADEARAGGGFSVAAEADAPEAFGEIPAFRMLSQTGAEVTGETLRGAPYVAAAFFTSCVGPCPRISREMAALQKAFSGEDVRLVSFSVDAALDTPERLREYGEAVGADPERWLLLTSPDGDEPIHRLLREGFRLGVQRAEDEAAPSRALTHGTRFVAVDAEGRIRGWYRSDDDAELGRLRQRMRHLAREARP